MKVKVNDAERETLNWMVAKAMGLLAAGRVVVDFKYMSGESPVRWEPQLSTYYSSAYSPTTDWAHGGPIIEWKMIELTRGTENSNGWTATIDLYEGDAMRESCTGPTPLIAAMRCYVASKLGDEVEVPDELIKGESK